MSDLIDRQALIGVFAGLVPWAIDSFEDAAYARGLDAGYQALVAAPAVDVRPQWISVKERMPESGKHVLACCEVRLLSGGKKRYVCEAMYTAKKSISVSNWDDCDGSGAEYDEETDEYYFPEGWWECIHNWDEYTSVAIADFVTHWMPLPELPKEVE